MTSSHKQTKLSPWLSWNYKVAIPAIFFVLFSLFGGYLGLSDDEAYYWVLAKNPALGYAYHPPMVAWFIALAQELGFSGTWAVRLPATASMSLILYWLIQWLPNARSAVMLLSFGAFFGLSWMMVPDTPLFLFFTGTFLLIARLCGLNDKKSSVDNIDYVLLTLTVAGGLLSKFSSVLWIGSAGLCILFWAPRPVKKKAVSAILAGFVLAMIPILVWNAQHEWGSILYQIRDRHGDSRLSGIRYLRFWGSQVLLVGLPLIIFFLHLLYSEFTNFKSTLTIRRFILVWSLPSAAVFFLQPAWSDFKPHWALIAWWPILILMAYEWGQGKFRRLGYFQIGYSALIVTAILMCCYWPMGGYFSKDAKMDVTNDLYGWDSLNKQLLRDLPPDLLSLPILGGRYQTASQAAFALRNWARVSMTPLDAKSKDEWPDLGATDGTGPEWPALKTAILFVTDNRYSAPPEFKRAHCKSLADFNTWRRRFFAKTIKIWYCEPDV